MGKGAQATEEPWAPTCTGRWPPETLSFVAISKARKKRGLIFYKEIARMRNIRTWAPQLSMDKLEQNFHFAKSSLLGRREWGPSLGC